ncbi:TonB-dependent receptor [Sphingomonas oryzagri]|uniref:TonB-dependent receptor n=1 Tax=Sphingomonas oryzagri TaxID=3042314 RepID=A0ABT6N215_9SPHN|nr:TonB-dependent receptor [Sphingomonas oryzagri]MDH7639262.1 TonB-dependent receptor [Sphingomonas oryzagri]
MKSTGLYLSRASAIAMAIGVAIPALAQDQQTGAPTNSAATTAAAPLSDGASQQPGDIVVTALRRSESVLKVPAAISVLSGNDLKTVGVNTVNDIQNLVAGVNIGSGAFGTNVSIRGVTSTDQTSKGELGIAFNIDGAFVGRGQEEGVAFFDLERVEVLKGPQGTLYGRSSTGGAINIITKKPVLGEAGGYAKVEYGNYNAKRAEGAVNVPLGSMFAARFAGSFNDRDGYLKPVDTSVTGSPLANNGAGPSNARLSANGLPAKNDQKDATGRASLLFKPSDNITATVIATVGHIGGDGNGTVTADALDHGDPFHIVPNPVPSYVRENFQNFNEQLNWKFGNMQLDLLGNEQHFKDNSQNTTNGNPFDTGTPTAAGSFALDQYHGVFNTNQFEARISNVNPGFFEYVAGANYYHEKINESDHNWIAPLSSTGGLSDTSEWINSIDPVNTTEHKSYGIFGQVTLHPLEKIAIIGGLRYTHDESTRTGTFAVGGVPGCTYPNNCIGSVNNGFEKDHKITYKAGINFQATPRDLFYASVSTGFKAGGFNDFDPRTGTTAPYGPESLTAYEIGYKGRPLEKLTITADAYYYDYSKDQINGLTLFPTPAGIVGVLFTQLAPVKIYGVEGEAHYQLDRSTMLNVSLAYEHSKIVRLQTGYLGYLTGAFADFSGYALPNTPHFVANLSATHSIDLGNGAELRLRAASKISSSYFLTDYANAVRYKQGSFTRSDASVTYVAAGDRYTIQIFVENIENKLQRTSGPGGYNGTYGGFTGGQATPEVPGSAFPENSVAYGVSTPRYFGVRLGVKF